MGSNEDADRAAISRIIANQDATWISGDAAGYSRDIAPDCVFTNIFGMVFTGREAFEAQHARIFAGIYRGTVLRQDIDRLRFIRPDVAIVNTSAHVTGRQDWPAGIQIRDNTLSTKLLQVMAKDAGNWAIVGYHNVDVKTPPSPPSGR